LEDAKNITLKDATKMLGDAMKTLEDATKSLEHAMKTLEDGRCHKNIGR
jgi:hypothetical protein